MTRNLQNGPKNYTAIFHSNGVNNNKYVIKQRFYWYFRTIMNNSM